jgi:hypothetical protein
MHTYHEYHRYIHAYTHIHTYMRIRKSHNARQASSFYIPVRSGSGILLGDRSSSGLLGTNSAPTSQALIPHQTASANPPNLLGYSQKSIRARYCVMCALHGLVDNVLQLIDLRRCVLHAYVHFDLVLIM